MTIREMIIILEKMAKESDKGENAKITINTWDDDIDDFEIYVNTQENVTLLAR